MTEFRNPDAPATSRQLWKLHKLTNEDTRDWKMTIAEASQKIESLQSEIATEHRWQAIPAEWAEFLATPMTFADIRLFFGDQRQGKSITAVASVIDDYYHYVTHVVSPQGEIIKANALSSQDVEELRKSGVHYDHLAHMRVFNEDESKSKIVKIPESFVVVSPIKVFSNFHFYGIRFVYADLLRLISYMNTPLLTNGWIVLDESVLTDKKESTTLVGKFMDWFGAQQGKRHLRMVIASQYPSMIQSRFHLFATTRVECTYEPDSAIVNLDVNKTSPVMTSTGYYSKPYRRFFNTDEIVAVPQYKIDRVMSQLVGSK